MATKQATIRAISAASLDAVIAIDHDDLIIGWNDKAERIFGWRSEDALGKTLRSTIVPTADRVPHSRGMLHYKQTGEAAIFGKRFERDALRADGSTIRIELSIMSVGKGSQEVLVCFLRDLTDEILARAALEDLQSQVINLSRINAMSTMASTIAHEINQPLTAVSTYLGGIDRLLSREQSTAVGEAREALRFAQEALMSAGNTIRTVREMVSRGVTKKEDHSLSCLVEDSIRLLRGSLSTEPVVAISADADCVHVNKVQIEQVLVNLIRNASEALSGRSHPRLQIEAARVADTIEVRVIDNGSGFAPGLEDPFAVSISSKPDGMGFGLSICRTIIENHLGSIWFETSLNGTAVCFTIPHCTENNS